MILQIDAGNTRIKWRVRDGLKTVAEGAQLTQSLRTEGLLKLPDVISLTAAQLSNVAGEDVTECLSRQLASQFEIVLQVAVVSAKVGAVTCGYRSPEQLGVDRWMAVLAAFRQAGRALIVIDAGSAVTVDIVNHEGFHKGGYIVPGVKLMQKALWQGTERVKVDQLTLEHGLIAGVTTEEAVGRGATLMLSSLIERLADEHRAELIITGGDGLLLQSQLSHRADYSADLVLDGLSVEGVSFAAGTDE
ncbi:type III pantothenate kinase [Porticoccaceae bacterium]|nr:type III pantothenate kinase [Porticoccaceae bacterium]